MPGIIPPARNARINNPTTPTIDSPNHDISAILRLPPELLINIFAHLDIVSATCLSLTHTRLHRAFRSVHRHRIPIALSEQVEIRDGKTVTWYFLSELLERWMLPRVLGCEVGVFKFVSWERWGVLCEEMGGDGGGGAVESEKTFNVVEKQKQKR
jgi:F-box domain